MRWLRRLFVGALVLVGLAGAAYATWQYMGRDRVRARRGSSLVCARLLCAGQRLL